MSRRPTHALGIDLAVGHVRDIGAALVGDEGITTLTLPMNGRPEVDALAEWIHRTATDLAVRVVSIDGPLGWKGPDTDVVHSRVSERAVRAPGKTGLPPDGVKPGTYLAFTRLSIALFERLTVDYGWRLPGDPRPGIEGAVLVTECFPTAIWRGLGVPPLPGKARATVADIEAAARRFAAATGLACPDTIPTHDGLQAIIAGYAGWRLALGDACAHLAGDPPFRLDGAWREGYILSVAPVSVAPDRGT